MIAVMVRVDPPLLRAMRRINPYAPGDAGLEGRAWNHRDALTGSAVTLRADARRLHREAFREIAPVLQAALEREREQHHAHLGASLTHLETRLFADYARHSVLDSTKVARADEFAAKLLATLRIIGTENSVAWWNVARDYVDTIDIQPGSIIVDLAEEMYLRDRALQRSSSLPSSIDPADVSDQLRRSATDDWWVVEDWARSRIRLTRTKPQTDATALGGPLRIDGGGALVRTIPSAASALERSRLQRPQRVHAHDPDVDLLALTDRSTIEIETSNERLRVEIVNRPRGALSWGREKGHLFVEAPPLAGLRARLQSRGIVVVRDEAEGVKWLEREGTSVPVRSHASPGNEGVSFGMDKFGIFGDLTITTTHGTASQRFRWIEPGEFIMGSPEGEAGRDSDEGPQHAVEITRGYWLADTACTQALWKVLTGKDPSHFKGDARPVENVSWSDAREALDGLNTLVPACAADLPTEAEWEFACRAGSTGPFSFGETVTTDQANFHGNFPYRDGPRGIYRSETLPAASFAPNQWGLYQMHGNVWEWCADGTRGYQQASVKDPFGEAKGESSRVVRGGSWFDVAGGARSAYRGAIPPGYRFRDLGFRFCLRSVKPSTLPPGGRPSSPEPGGRPSSPEPGGRPSSPEPGGRPSSPEPGGRGTEKSADKPAKGLVDRLVETATKPFKGKRGRKS